MSTGKHYFIEQTNEGFDNEFLNVALEAQKRRWQVAQHLPIHLARRGQLGPTDNVL